jgi:hypothetical protein
MGQSAAADTNTIFVDHNLNALVSGWIEFLLNHFPLCYGSLISLECASKVINKTIWYLVEIDFGFVLRQTV